MVTRYKGLRTFLEFRGIADWNVDREGTSLSNCDEDFSVK